MSGPVLSKKYFPIETDSPPRYTDSKRSCNARYRRSRPKAWRVSIWPSAYRKKRENSYKAQSGLRRGYPHTLSDGSLRAPIFALGKDTFTCVQDAECNFCGSQPTLPDPSYTNPFLFGAWPKCVSETPGSFGDVRFRACNINFDKSVELNNLAVSVPSFLSLLFARDAPSFSG